MSEPLILDAMRQDPDGAVIFRPSDPRHGQSGQSARAVVDYLDSVLADGPRLGLATTRELLAEIAARIDVDHALGGGGLDYCTVTREHVT